MFSYGLNKPYLFQILTGFGNPCEWPESDTGRKPCWKDHTCMHVSNLGLQISRDGDNMTSQAASSSV